MKWILIHADHRCRPPALTIREWPNEEYKEAAKAQLELEFKQQPHEEVVLFGADSVEVLHKTHPRYFPPPKGGRLFEEGPDFYNRPAVRKARLTIADD